MGEFTLDTSGSVDTTERAGDMFINRAWRWSDLDAFTQGYVEAALAELDRDEACWIDGVGHVSPKFSDLAPEAVALIRRDCAAHEKAYPLTAHDPRRHGRGRNFWRNRQAGMWTSSGWPVLTVSLGDDGRVYLRASS